MQLLVDRTQINTDDKIEKENTFYTWVSQKEKMDKGMKEIYDGIKRIITISEQKIQLLEDTYR